MTIDLIAAPNPITWQMSMSDIHKLKAAKRITQEQMDNHIKSLFTHKKSYESIK